MDEQHSAALPNSANAAQPVDASIQEVRNIHPQHALGISGNRSVLLITNIVWTAIFAVLLLAGLASYGVSRFGSFGGLVAALRGRTLYIEPARIPLGSLKSREQVNVLVRLRNLASKPIKILGSYSPCGCLVAKELPIELAPGEVKDVPIYLTAPASDPAEFEVAVSFYTNVAGEQSQVVLHGCVLSADTESGNPRNEG